MQRSLLTFLLVSGFSALLHAQEPEKASPSVNFVEHVLPIFRQHCLQCHNANDAEAGLAIDSYGALMEGGGSGDVVTDGDASSSRLYLVMTHDEEPTMPPNQDPIPAEQLDIIKRWIEGGLLENSGSKARKRKGPSLSFSTSATGKPDEIILPESVWRVPVVTSQRAAAATAIAASPWAPLVAVAGQRQVALYHTETNDLMGVLPYPEGIPQVLRFNRDGGYLLVAGGAHSSMGMASLYDVRNGSRLLSVGDELDVVFGADINDSMSRIALGGPQKMVRIFDTDSGESVFELKKHTDWIYCVDYSPDGVLVASGDRSGGLHVWEAETGRLYLDLIGHKGAVRSLVWRADSNVLLSASEDGTVKMWEMNAGNQLKSFNAHSGGVTGISMAQDGKIVTSGKDRTVKVWNADGSAIATMPAFTEPALEVAITHDSSRVVGGDWNGRTLMWQIADPKIVTELAANPPELGKQTEDQASHVEKLSADRNAIVQRQKAGQQIIAAQVQSEKDLSQQVANAKTALKAATDGKAAAEAKQKMLAMQNQTSLAKAKEYRVSIEETNKKLQSLATEREAAEKQLQAATERWTTASDANERAAQSITENNKTQDAVKSEVAKRTSDLLKREMDLLAKMELASTKLNEVVASKNEVEEKIKTATAAIEQAKQMSAKHTEQLKVATNKLSVAQEAEKKLNASRIEIDKAKSKNDADIAALRTQLETTKEESDQASLKQQIMELESLASDLTVKAKDSQAAIVQSQGEQKKLTDEITQCKTGVETQGKEMVQLMASVEQLKQSLTGMASVIETKTAAKAEAAKQLDSFQGELNKAKDEKQQAVKKVAVLISEESNLSKKVVDLQAAVTKEAQSIESYRQAMKDMDLTKEKMTLSMNQATESLAKEDANLASLAGELAKMPALIETMVRDMSTQQKAIPELEAKLTETANKRQESQKMLTAVDQELVQADAKLSQANAKLTALQSELVAFESTAKRLRDEAQKASQLATQQREKLVPLKESVTALETAIADRENKMKAAAAEFARIEKELKALEQKQAEAEVAKKQAMEKFNESNAAFEEVEVAEQEAKEKLEFFESAYGI